MYELGHHRDLRLLFCAHIQSIDSHRKILAQIIRWKKKTKRPSMKPLDVSFSQILCQIDLLAKDTLSTAAKCGKKGKCST